MNLGNSCIYLADSKLVFWSIRGVNEVCVEDVELVALHYLGWGVVLVVVSLVILVPLVTLLVGVLVLLRLKHSIF